MKTIQKILIVVSLIVIIVGLLLLWKNGLNYIDGYSKKMLLKTINEYILYVGISTAIILLYYAIRYFKKGIIKVIATSVLGMLSSILFTLSLMSIIQMPINRLFFPIMLATYVASIIVLSASFEENT